MMLFIKFYFKARRVVEKNTTWNIYFSCASCAFRESSPKLLAHAAARIDQFTLHLSYLNRETIGASRLEEYLQ